MTADDRPGDDDPLADRGGRPRDDTGADVPGRDERDDSYPRSDDGDNDRAGQLSGSDDQHGPGPREQGQSGSQDRRGGQPGKQQGSGPGPGPQGQGQGRRGQPGSQDTGEGRPDGPPGDGRGGNADDRPSTGRRIGVFLLATLLTISLAGTGLIYAAQGTALNADYVSGKINETGAAGEIETEAEDAVLDRAADTIPSTQYIPNLQGVVDGTIRSAVTESYVQRTIETNLRQLFGYLNGSQELDLAVDTEPVLDRVGPSVGQSFESLPVARLLSRDVFATQAQQALRQAARNAGAREIIVQQIRVQNISRSYTDRAAFREQQQRITRLIRETNLEPREINRSIAERTRATVGSQLGGSQAAEAVAEDLIELQQSFIAAYTDPDIGHEAFRGIVDQRRSELAESVGQYAEQRAAQQVESTIDVDEQLTAGDRQTLADVRDGITTLGTAGLALPVAILVLLLLILGVSHSVSKTARAAGGSLLGAGIVGLVASTVGNGVVSDRIQQATQDVEQEFVADTVTAVVDGLFGSLTTYNVVLVALGVVLVVVYFLVDRREPGVVPAGWR